jgi:hypothetical protein
MLPEHLCFSIETIGTMDDACRLSVDMKLIEAELEPSIKENSKRQHAKRGNRAANIEKLIVEMTKHLRASRAHYDTTKHLLPRPSQTMLARCVGIRQDDVSRCLNDSDAAYLKLLWENAEDISFVVDHNHLKKT